MDERINKDEFISEIQQRNIRHLIHFTPTINLYSMLENGVIMSRSELENLDIDVYDILDYAQFTDAIRYDDKRYINLSISGPNTFLFSKFRERTKSDCTIQWCVIKINPRYIYATGTLFSVTNAASNAARRDYGIGGDLEKFKQLFQQSLVINSSRGKRVIERQRVSTQYTTDVQAEVLVKQQISIDDIIEISFQDENDLAQAKAAMNNFDTSKFIVDSNIFNPNRSL